MNTADTSWPQFPTLHATHGETNSHPYLITRTHGETNEHPYSLTRTTYLAHTTRGEIHTRTYGKQAVLSSICTAVSSSGSIFTAAAGIYDAASVVLLRAVTLSAAARSTHLLQLASMMLRVLCFLELSSASPTSADKAAELLSARRNSQRTCQSSLRTCLAVRNPTSAP